MSDQGRAAVILRQRFGAFEVAPEYEYAGWKRRQITRASIDSRAGTVLLKATANVDEDDLRRMVDILNEAISKAPAFPARREPEQP